MSDSTSTLNIRIGSSGDFTALTLGKEQLEGITKAAEGAREALGAFGIGSVASLGGFVEMLKKGTELASSIVDLSARLQLSTDAFQTLSASAMRAGLDSDTLATILGRLRGTIDEAAVYGGKAAAAFETLGLNAQVLSKAPLERVLEAIAVQIQNATDKTAAYAAAVQILGAKYVPKLQEVLKELGVEGYDALNAKTAKITKEQLEQAHAFEVGFMGMVRSVEAFAARIPAAFNSALATMKSGFSEIGSFADDLFGDGPAADLFHGPGKAPSAPPAENPVSAQAQALIAASANANQLKADEEEITAQKKLQNDLEKIARGFVDAKLEANKQVIRSLDDEVETAKKLVDPFYDIEKKAQAVNDAFSKGAITADQMKAAIAALNAEAWDKGLDMMGFGGGSGGGSGSIKKKQTNFQNTQDAYSRSQSSDPNTNPSYMTAAQGAESALMQFGTKVGSVGQQVNSVFNTAFTSINNNLVKVIQGTETWRKGLMSIVTSIEGSVINAFVQMAEQWIVKQILMATTGRTIAASSAAAMIPIAMAQSEIWAAPAALSTIASYGGAAVAAPMEIMGAMAATEGLALASSGGFFPGNPTDIAGLFHGDEFVFSAPAVRAIGADNLTAMHDMAKGNGSSATMPAASGSGTGDIHIHTHTDHQSALKAAMRSRSGRHIVHDAASRTVREYNR